MNTPLVNLKLAIIITILLSFHSPSATFADANEVVLDEIPPTIMFHARADQRDVLPALINELLASGYQFTTYSQFYAAFQNGERLEKPIIFTFDDLTLVEGSSNFRYYAQIVDILQAKGVPAVFAVITEPVIAGSNGTLVQLTDQNPEYWELARQWAEQGIEFATHTESHPNLDNPMLTQADLDREIAGSAQLVESYLGTPVTTLITPYGSGVTQAGSINPRILTALEDTSIHFVAGISVLRQPAANGSAVYAVGRIMPNDAQPERLFGSLVAETRRWTEFNQTLL